MKMKCKTNKLFFDHHFDKPYVKGDIHLRWHRLSNNKGQNQPPSLFK